MLVFPSLRDSEASHVRSEDIEEHSAGEIYEEVMGNAVLCLVIQQKYVSGDTQMCYQTEWTTLKVAGTKLASLITLKNETCPHKSINTQSESSRAKQS